MEMIGRLVATMFLAREYAHRAHLRVTGPGSYAKHVALGEFYEEIIENADSIDRKSTRLNSSHVKRSRMPSSA